MDVDLDPALGQPCELPRDPWQAGDGRVFRHRHLEAGSTTHYGNGLD